MDQPSIPAHDLLAATADIVAAYVGNNHLPGADLAALIGEVHGALTRLGEPIAPAEPEYKPAVSIRKSITPDHLISLIDGKPYKALKRHLTSHGLTPAEYRTRYGLPADYPMAAASYSARRSELAKAAGLGQQRKGKTKAAALAPRPVQAETPKKRARAKKADTSKNLAV